jgi:DeoR/GlpR family transcriptional regulator of sugar metabolism
MKLICQQSTGTPPELAERMNVSERTIRRMIAKLRKDQNILFCRKTGSYIIKD